MSPCQILATSTRKRNSVSDNFGKTNFGQRKFTSSQHLKASTLGAQNCHIVYMYCERDKRIVKT